MRIEINGDGKRDDSYVNGGMRDKKFFGRGRVYLFDPRDAMVLKLTAGARYGRYSDPPTPYSENSNSNQRSAV